MPLAHQLALTLVTRVALLLAKVRAQIQTHPGLLPTMCLLKMG